jgi:hypothetical protein
MRNFTGKKTGKMRHWMKPRGRPVAELPQDPVQYVAYRMKLSVLRCLFGEKRDPEWEMDWRVQDRFIYIARCVLQKPQPCRRCSGLLPCFSPRQNTLE